MGKHNYVINSKTIASDLLACKTAFDSAGVPWVIIGGIVLGYARYNKIMEWDTDLDVAVFTELTKVQWNKLYQALRKNGFRINSKKMDFIYGGRKVPFNMMLYHKKDNFYETFPQTMKGFKYVEKAEWYDNPQPTKFLDNYYPMPEYINDYVNCHYGKDWKTNIIKDHAEYFKEKRGNPKNPNSWIFNRKRKGDENLWWPALLKIEENIGDFNEV